MHLPDPVAQSVPRRAILFGSVSVLAGSATGCSFLSLEPDQGGGNGGGEKGLEAPGLAQKAGAGDLPPLEERLPPKPLVVPPNDRTGVYGGTWNSVISGTSDRPWLRNTIGYDGLLRWDAAWERAIPNVAESFEVNPEGTEFTFVLREGIRWSDGEPFTAADVAFAYNDIVLHPDMASAASVYEAPNGEAAKLELVDDRTIVFRTAVPDGLFIDRFAGPDSLALTTCPKHYLSQFHLDHNPEAKQLAKDEGQASWLELLAARAAVWDNPELPVLHAWTITTPIIDGARCVAERNPYYWKVDPEGSQLPYLDRVVYDVVQDTETMVLQAANGDINMHSRHFNTGTNRPVLAENRERGKFDFFELVLSGMNDMVIQLNLNHKDPKWRSLFQTKDFRVGLSHAINRKEIIDAAFQGQGIPSIGAPSEKSQFYDESWTTQYTEYDVDLANTHLDRAGITKRNADGVRMLPDGSGPVSFTVELANPAPVGGWVAGMELVRNYWSAVGVNVRINAQDRTIWSTVVDGNNDHDACVWGGVGGLGNEILDGYLYLPKDELGPRYATQWALWYVTEGKRGEEPPEAVRRQLELYDQVLGTVDAKERAELFREVLAIAKDQFYVIGTIASTSGYGIVAKNFHNVPDSMPSANTYANPGPTRPEQFFISDE